MTSIAQHIVSTKQHREWTLDVRFGGVGRYLSNVDLTAAGDDARTRFCLNRAPNYAASQPAGLWAPLLKKPFDLVSERADRFGGVVRPASVTIDITDAQNVLTTAFQPDAAPVSRLAADVSRTATTVQVEDGSAHPVGSVLYVRAEAMRVDAVATNTLTVTRGYLATDAEAHEAGAPTFDVLPRLEGVVVDVYVGPADGSTASETRVGRYLIEELTVSEDANDWRLQCREQLPGMKRRLAEIPRVVVVDRIDEESGVVRMRRPDASQRVSDFQVFPESFPDFTFRKVGGKEVFRGGRDYSNRFTRVGDRDLIGTGRDDFELGDEARQVFVAKLGGLRYSLGPSPETVRTINWTNALHFVPLTLILMTSARDDDDGLELTNYIGAYGNFASLPPGYGAGVLANRIDWLEAFNVWNRTPDYVFPNFVFGDEPVELGDLLTENFLRPIGAYLTFRGGLARLVLPATPTIGQSSFTLGPSDVLRRAVGRGQYRPRARVHRTRAENERGILLKLGPTGRPIPPIEAPHSSNDKDARLQSIEIPGADPEDAELWKKRMVNRLRLSHRPRPTLAADVDVSILLQPYGSVGQVTLPEQPDFRGGRGWTDQVVQVSRLEETVDVDKQGRGDGVYVRLQAEAYGTDQLARRICPAGYISGVSGTEVTLVANRYTQADAPTTLPSEDEDGFSVGDVVVLRNLDGSDAGGGGTETIDSLKPITLSGDFSGNLAIDLVLAFAGFDDASAAQRASYVFSADAATLTPGSVGTTPYAYVEP